jgi:hypothetical protein
MSVGFDSLLFDRRALETPERVFKAHLAVGVSVERESDFRSKYEQALDDVFSKKGMKRKKCIYKGHHFRLQAKSDSSEMIGYLLDELSESISRIDVYCGYYPMDDISIYGEASGQTIKRLTFLERTQHGYHHVCAWRYIEDFGTDCRMKLDYFSGEKTPAWDALIKKKPNIELYFNGCECDPLISTADLVLALIDLHQYGTISGLTLLNPIRKACTNLANSRKLVYHEMKRYLHMATPTVPLPMNVSSFIKHPIFFIVWNPEAPRKRVKPMFEWSPLYNSVVRKALCEEGCFKFISPEEDHVFWDCGKDKLVTWSKVDEEMVGWMKQMDFETPSVLKKEDLTL